MARLSCGVNCTSAALFAMNIVFLILGLTVMGFGIYLRVNGNFNTIAEISNLSDALSADALHWVAIGMIILGIFTAILASFGCLGAVLHRRGLLYIYALILSLIIIVEFAAFISVLVYRSQLWKSYDSGFMEVFHYSYTHNKTEAIRVIEKLEREFKCCGVDGPSDYILVGHRLPPPSCYSNQSPLHFLYSSGCAVTIANWLWAKLPWIAGLLGGVFFIELFGVISSIVLGVAIAHSAQSPDYSKF